MTQLFSKDGERFPVTEINAGPCAVAFERTTDKDGYLALGLSFGTKRVSLKKEASQRNKPLFLREIRVSQEEKLPVGEVITVDKVFTPGDLVNVTGWSKGWGFAGVVKRHHFKGGPRTHGQSDRERAPGSIGSTTTPGRVMKGKRMPGKEGNKRKTLKNLLVVKVDAAGNKLFVKGAVPGKPKELLIIKNTGLKSQFAKEII